ncbi:MAG: hypothetical protein HXS46_12155 [Theionarchaea archaeon]|nr:hypothetical protein [Theionarchaea archaeon]
MKKTVIIFMVILATGCIQQKNEIEFSDLNEDLSCIFCPDIEEIIITSQEEYENLLECKSDSPACRGFVLPYIDFSENVLLGKYVYGSGCSITFERHVYRDDAAKKIIYSITVIEEGLCEMMGMSMNWITIPTIPGYTIVFEVNKQERIFPLVTLLSAI